MFQSNDERMRRILASKQQNKQIPIQVTDDVMYLHSNLYGAWDDDDNHDNNNTRTHVHKNKTKQKREKKK